MPVVQHRLRVARSFRRAALPRDDSFGAGCNALLALSTQHDSRTAESKRCANQFKNITRGSTHARTLCKKKRRPHQSRTALQEQETTYTVGIGISQHIRMVKTTVNASMSVIRFIFYYCRRPDADGGLLIFIVFLTNESQRSINIACQPQIFLSAVGNLGGIVVMECVLHPRPAHDNPKRNIDLRRDARR